MPTWLRRLRARWRYRHFQDDVAREIEAHRAMAQSALERSGVDADAARAQAARALGNVTLMREEARSVWIAAWIESLWQDAKYAARSFRRRPGFAATIVLILSLGGGLVTAVFSIGYGVFLRPWPVPDPNAVVLLRPRPATAVADYTQISLVEFQYLERRARTFQHLAFTERSVTRPGTYRGATVANIRPLYVSSGYLDVLRTAFLHGRGFTADEQDSTGSSAVVVLSRGLWRRAFASDPNVVGQLLQFGRHTYTIVGVADMTGFVDSTGNDFEMVLPLGAMLLGATDADRQEFLDPRRSSPVSTRVGRLAPGVTEAQAVAELTALSRQFRDAERLPPIDMTFLSTRQISRRGGSSDWQVAQLAFLALLLVHLLACANAGNLLLARGLARQREMAIRQSLGAGRGRLIRQLFVETLSLSAVAGGLALGVAYGVPPLVASLTNELPPGNFSPGGVVFGFCATLAVITALAAGLAPALRSTARSVGPLSGAGQSPPPRALRLRRALLSTQVALATTLLAGAGLLGRAVSHASTFDPGFAINELQAIDVRLPPPASMPRNQAFFRDLYSALASTGQPGIAFTDEPPLSGSRWAVFARRPDAPSSRPRVLRRVGVSANYFDVMGVALIEGRPPSQERPLDAVISARAARELWPDGENPLGKTLLDGLNARDTRTLTIVGVAEDVAINSMTDFEPSIYLTSELARPTLLVRDLGPATVERVRAVAGGILQGVTVTSHPLRDNIRSSLTASIIGSQVAWGIGALGLLLATIGAFGVFAYAVEERKREIGIRMALGAGRADVVGAVWATAQRAMIVGLAVGLVLAMGGAQLLRRFLHGLSPFDPIAYLQIAAILLAAAALATWIPARRAARVDPAVTLRTD